MSIDALQSFDDFRDNYQATVTQPLPLFRRRLTDASDAAGQLTARAKA